MKTEKERLISSLEYEINKANELLEALNKLPIDLISETFPQGSWSRSWANSFEFTLPLSFQLIADVKTFMENQLPEFGNPRENQYVWDDSKSAGHFLEYCIRDGYKRVVEFQFGFRSGKEGSQCVLNQIGVKEVPVFEVICPEGAEEGLP